MLHAIVDYAASHEVIAEPGFKPKAVRWLIVFSNRGEFLHVFDTTGGERHSKGRIFSACPDLTQPEMVSAGGGCRHFLVDDVGVVALLTKDGTVDDKQAAKHEYFVNLLRGAATDVPVLADIASELSAEATLAKIRQQLVDGKAKPTDLATFAVGEAATALVDQDNWHDWWRSFRAGLVEQRKAKAAGKRGAVTSAAEARQRCLLSGELIEPLMTSNKVEGLADVGGLPTGDALASFDKEAFCSFGLQQGANAAMSEQMVKTYTSALNDLIKNHSRRLAGVKVVYWYSGRVDLKDDVLADLFGGVDFREAEDSDQAEVVTGSKLEAAQAESRAARLLDAIRTGQRPELADCRYYALTLSANSGRVVIRDWTEGQFEDLAKAVNEWLADLGIVNVNGQSLSAIPSLESAVCATLPDRKPSQKYVDWIRPVGGFREALWRCALLGRKSAIPPSVARRVVAEHSRRVASGHVAAALDPKGEKHALRLHQLYVRIGLLKMYLVRRKKGLTDMLSKIDETLDDPCYQFGRLVAVLADLQRQALRKESGETVKSSIVDRFYTAASTAPRLVHGRLISLSNHHLRKLDQQKGGARAAGAIRARMADISNCIDPKRLPTAMRLEEQSMFALGYYHQIADMNRARREGRTPSDNVEEADGLSTDG